MSQPSPIALGLISQVQRKQYYRLGWPAPRDLEYDPRDFILPAHPRVDAERTKKYWDKIAEISKSLPEYQEPTSFYYLQTIISDIDSVSGRFGINLATTPLPATLPIGDINAMTVFVPSTDERIIFLDAGLVMFVCIMACAVSLALPTRRRWDGQFQIDLSFGNSFGYDDVDKISERLAAVDETRNAIARAVITYATNPQPIELVHLLVRYFRADHSTAMALMECVISFVVGHEYGHIRSGENSHGDWLSEILADDYGVCLSTAAMILKADHGVELAAVGAEFYFGCLDLVYRTVSVLRYGDENHLSGPTHPDPDTRRAYQRRMMEKSFGESDARVASVFGRILERMLTMVWDTMRPDVIALRQRGVPASQVWHQ